MGFPLNLFTLSSLVLVVSLGLSHNGVECDTNILTDEEDDLELERQVKLLKKPSIKTTVKTHVGGDVYDCIDIWHQPSLDHPLLKNHKIQMRPNSRPNHQMTIGTSSLKAQKVDLVTVDCPKGTVPIRRIGKEFLRRAKEFTKSYARNIHQMTEEPPGTHFSIIRSKRDIGKIFWAVGGVPSVHNLTVGANQSSSAHFWIETSLDNLQTGWMVSPDLYGDTRTRLFVYWETSGYDGCFNLLCSPGFVQVNQNTPVDIVINQTSEYGGAQFVVPIYIEQDLKSSNWWLRIDEDIYIGYFPSGLAPDLDENGGSLVAWGGLVTGPTDIASPPMGNGRIGKYDYQYMAFYHNIQFVDESNLWMDPNLSIVETYSDKFNCYRIRYDEDIGGGFGHSFLYGGPGGDCGVV